MSEQNSRFNYISIPIELVACPFFTNKEKEVLSEIISISDKYLENGGCSRTNKNLAFRHRISASKVSNIITTANRLGFVINREDKVHERKSESGRFSFYSTERKIIIRIPEEWQIMGDLYNGAFIREDMEIYEQFILVETELKQIDIQDITQEKVKEILAKNLDYHICLEKNTPHTSKKVPPLNKNLQASNKSGIYKSEKINKSDLKDICQKSSISPDSIISLWNKIAKENELPSVSKLTPSRKSKILSRCKSQDLSRLSDWKNLFDKIQNCPFLLGDGNTGWKVSLDWLVRNDENYIRVLEDEFTVKKNSSSKSGRKSRAVPGKYDFLEKEGK